MTPDKTNALGQIASLAHQHGLSSAEIIAYMAENLTPSPRAETENSPPSDRVGKMVKAFFAYLGATFVLSGLGLLIGMMWDDMSSLQRVIIILGPGIAAFVIACLAAEDPRLQIVMVPFFLMAFFLQPAGIFVFLREFFESSGDPRTPFILVMLMLMIQMGIAFWRYRKTLLVLFAVVAGQGALLTMLDLLSLSGRTVALIFGLSVMALARAADRSPHRALAPLGYIVGGTSVLSGVWWLLSNLLPFKAAYLAVNSFLIYLSLLWTTRTLLVVGAMGMMAYLTYFTAEYFAHVVGWPLALIIAGGAMIGFSAYAFGLARKMPGRAD